MAEEKYIEVGGRLHSIATGNVLAGANEIFDDDKGKKQSDINTETDAALDDRYTKGQTYSKSELNNMITTPNQEYFSVTATDQTTAVTDVLPATGEADTVYRVGNWDGSQYDSSVYSEYAWNGSQYVHLSTKTQIGEVFDISAYHATGGTLATYADLSAALDSNNGGGVPQSLQKGGMSVKFVQSSDNKYVQYRLMAETFTTDTTKWAVCEEGVYAENPEFAVVFVDAKKRIGYGLKKSGDFYFGAGCPQQVKDYITPIINSLLAGIDAKVDKVPGKGLSTNDYTDDDKSVVELERLTENREWLYALLDAKNRIFEGVKIEGKRVIYIPVEIDADFAVSGNINIKSSSEISVYNKEWLYLLMDKLGHIIEGLKKEGRKEVYIDTFFNKIRFLSDESKQDFIDYLDVQIRQELSQLVVDLPVSDGTDIQSGYAYIDSTDRCVKVKA